MEGASLPLAELSADDRDPPPVPPASAALLEVRHLGKRFGPVTALTDASLTCRTGEIHALMGANGAGKSTLVKIISGVFPPDEGEILLGGQALRLESPAQAARLGIATVFQELSLFPHRTVAENVYAGHEPRRLGLVHRAALRRGTRDVFARLGIQHLDPDALVNDLSLADRQLIEIAKALVHDPRVLILDEGTSALAAEEVTKLFKLLRVLREQGLAIIFISHRIPELREIADRITILRDGRDVLVADMARFDESRLMDLVLGDAARAASIGAPRAILAETAPLLTVTNLSVPGRLRDVSLDVACGEVLGLTGLEGQGQSDLLLALFGVYRNAQGRVSLHGRSLRPTAPWRVKRASVAYIPNERKTAGLILGMSVRENIALPNLRRLTRFGMILRARERDAAEEMRGRLAIKTASIDEPAGALSGGNQQKVLIAKWLASDAELYLLHDPTRGIDIGAKQFVYAVIRELSAQGKAVILYSTETEELVSLCHRVLVMDRGRILCQLREGEIGEDAILRASVGLAADTEIAEARP
jgi:ribose transport system ATP-binding protein